VVRSDGEDYEVELVLAGADVFAEGRRVWWVNNFEALWLFERISLFI